MTGGKIGGPEEGFRRFDGPAKTCHEDESVLWPEVFG